MSTVQRSEIIDYQSYEDVRPEFQKKVMAEKNRRRVHVGDCFTFLFENALTVRYQVQEMMRVEKIVREKDILHELQTYNSLLGAKGELGCTLLIEIEDPSLRAEKLRDWLKLPAHVYALLEDGTRIRPSFDPSQIGKDRLSSVQYLKFPVGGRVPAAIGVDFPGISAETALSQDQREALREDLS